MLHNKTNTHTIDTQHLWNEEKHTGESILAIEIISLSHLLKHGDDWDFQFSNIDFFLFSCNHACPESLLLMRGKGCCPVRGAKYCQVCRLAGLNKWLHVVGVCTEVCGEPKNCFFIWFDIFSEFLRMSQFICKRVALWKRAALEEKFPKNSLMFLLCFCI